MTGSLRDTHTFLLPDLVEVRGGSFVMGSEAGRPDERPLHRVTVQPFDIAVTPVTNREYACFVDAGQPPPKFWHDPRFNRAAQPVVGVPWGSAAAYCDWLGAESGRAFRLPTEAEWEYAAMGGAQGCKRSVYPWGNAVPIGADGVSLADRPMDHPAAAGSGPENPLGLRDMGWNIHEWCSDWYGATYYSEAPERDPHGPVSGTRRTSRGGAWRHQIKISRCTARSAIPPEFEYSDYGFRLCAGVS